MAIGAPVRVYEEFNPSSELVSEQGCDVFRVSLPGFKKDQLKVQLTTSRLLRVSGERPIGENKWRRFQKEFQVSPNCNTKDIAAKFEGGILHIKLPSSKPQTTTHQDEKIQDKTKPTVEAPKPQQPQPQPPPPNNVPEKDATLKANEEKAKKEKKEMLEKKDEEERKLNDPSGVTEASKEMVSNGRSFFMWLKKPQNLMKKAIIPAFVLLILGLYIIFMFKSFSGIEDQEQSLLEFDYEL